MICKSACATCVHMPCVCAELYITSVRWMTPDLICQINTKLNIFLPFFLETRVLYSTFKWNEPQISHPRLFLHCCKIQSNFLFFPVSFNKGLGYSHLAQMDTHAETKTKKALTEASLLDFSPLALISEDPFPDWTLWQLCMAPWGWTRASFLMLEIKNVFLKKKTTEAAAGQLATETFSFSKMIMSALNAMCVAASVNRETEIKF